MKLLIDYWSHTPVIRGWGQPGLWKKALSEKQQYQKQWKFKFVAIKPYYIPIAELFIW